MKKSHKRRTGQYKTTQISRRGHKSPIKSQQQMEKEKKKLCINKRSRKQKKNHLIAKYENKKKHEKKYLVYNVSEYNQ